jgi:hypothetical protein
VRARLLLILALAGLAGAASAETMSVTESASYPMSDEESRNAGRQHCVESAKHTALDRAGSVFEAEMKNERSESGQDEAKLKMRSYFAGVVSSEMVGDQVNIDSQGRATETCTVKIGYDPDTVSAKLREIADAEGLRKQVAAQQGTIASLQSQVQQSQPPPPAAAPAPQVIASALPPAGFAAPPLTQTAQAQEVPQAAPLQAPHALVPYTPPAPRPVYYAPPVPAPVYYAPPSAPRPVYYAPVPAPVVYYAPRPTSRPILVVRPVRVHAATMIRRLYYWRP